MNDHHATSLPSPWVVRFAHLVPVGARVLDLACGFGRHARFLAARGANVLAADRDRAALASLDGVPRISTLAVDLEAETWPFAGTRFDAIVVVNYLHRPHLAALAASLAHDGLLLYETFCVGNESYGRPTNPAFLLRACELLDIVAAATPRLDVVAYEEGFVAGSERGAVVQRIAAVGATHLRPVSLHGDTPRAPRG
jgi:SAM-dependent methyltransferase